ncbi:EAL domain-containing protein [Niveispirillum sp. KHB5.9]|uniref:EAL domain-containing protein n=1 Tax=Niveispirillum sp. KHB5.9 TaxID=3400269 RepID=UPI003A87D679
MMCSECEALPSLGHPDNILMVRLPTRHTRDKLLALARAQDVAMEPMDDPLCLHLRLSQTELARMMLGASEVLSREEQLHGRSLLLPAGRHPETTDLLAAIPLRQLIAGIHGSWLVQLLEEERYFSVLQPIFHADGSVFGYEALLRGRTEAGAMLSPGPLFSVAEEAGMLFALDQKARRSAIATMARRPRDGARLFVNFNPAAIYDPSYCLQSTQELVRHLGLSPADIVFEVTETTKVHDHGHLRSILDYYRAAGFRVALDDIGAGFSGLNLLQALHPDFMKIDMALIRGIDGDAYKQSIVRHLIGIARDGGAVVIGEGVETEAERDWLVAAGIDLMQGFLLGRPEPVPG